MAERLYRATEKDRKQLQIALTIALANGVASLGVPYRAEVDPLGGTEYYFDTVPGGAKVSVAGGFIHSFWGDHKAVGLPHWKQNQHVFIDGKMPKAERKWAIDSKPQQAVANVLRLIKRHAVTGGTVASGPGTAVATAAVTKATGAVKPGSYTMTPKGGPSQAGETYGAELTKQGDVYLTDYRRRRRFIGTADHIKGGVMSGAERWEARRPAGASAPTKADFMFVDKQYQSRAAQAFPPKNQAIQWLVDQSGVYTAQKAPARVKAPATTRAGVTGVQLFNAVYAVLQANPATRDTALWMQVESHKVMAEFNKTADAVNAKRAKVKPSPKAKPQRGQALGDWSGSGRRHAGDKAPLHLMGAFEGGYGAVLLVGEASKYLATNAYDAKIMGFSSRNFNAEPKDAFGSFTLIREAAALDWLAFGQILRSGAVKGLHKTPQDWYNTVRTACGKAGAQGIPTVVAYYKKMVAESDGDVLTDDIDAPGAEEMQNFLVAMYVAAIFGVSAGNAEESWKDPTGKELQEVVLAAVEEEETASWYAGEEDEARDFAVDIVEEAINRKWFKERKLTIPRDGDQYDQALEISNEYTLFASLAFQLHQMLGGSGIKDRESVMHSRAWQGVRAATGVRIDLSPYFGHVEPKRAALAAKAEKANWKKVGDAYVRGSVSIAKTGRGNTAWIRTSDRIGGGRPHETGHPTLKAAKKG